MRLDRRLGVDDGNAGRNREAELIGGDGEVGSLAREREAGDRPVGLFNLDAGNDAFCGDGQREAVDATFLALRLTGELVGAVRCVFFSATPSLRRR
jgi:hypothetical protein